MRASPSVLFTISILFSLSEVARASPGGDSETLGGFYLRTDLGLGVLVSKAMDEPLVANANQDEPSIALDLLVGHELSESVACGGALLLEQGFAPGSPANDTGGRAERVRSGVVGPFLDLYPPWGSGVHLGGTLGLSWTRFDSTGGSSLTVNALGLGGALWVGQDVAVSSHWSLGPLIRLVGERERDTATSDDRAWAQSLTLALTAVYRSTHQ